MANNIFFLDDNQVVYPAGHNIVVYHMEERTQKTYPCIEGSEGITAMALSDNRRSLAVAEKSDKIPILTIYKVDDDKSGTEERKTDAKVLKRRRIMCSTDVKQHKAWISMSFCHHNDKFLATLSSEPDQTVYIWQVDKQRHVCSQVLGHSVNHAYGTQVKFSSLDPNVLLITGNQTYKYCVRKDENLAIQTKTMNKKEYSHISTNYTAHCWLEGGKILVGTDQGQILLCEANGEVKRGLNDAPGEGFYIEQMIKYKNAFICVGDKGQMTVYSQTGEPNNPF